MEEMRLSTKSCAPVPIASMATTEPTPMTMPSKVRMVRKRLARNARNAIFTASVTSAIAAEPSLTVRLSAWAASGLLRLFLVRSATMRPSWISISRSACSATSREWVMTMTVWPLSFMSRKSAMTSEPLWLSSAPVGSSASTTRPPFISARAIDTRCCWPPESWFGRWSSRSPSFS